MSLGTLYRDVLPLPVLEVRNEEIVDEFEYRTRALCTFVGLDWEDAMRGFAKASQARAIATPSAMQVARGISSEGIGHWRHYRQELDPVLPVLTPWVERHGYVQ